LLQALIGFSAINKAANEAPTLHHLSAQLAVIDWSAPWWQPWRVTGQRVAQRVIDGASVAQALNAENPVKRCVAQADLPEGVAYEQFIYTAHAVPTRDNLHDFFNGLAWIVFPQVKQRLNQLQAGEISAAGVNTTRGALRDALTLFDENAALWPLAGGAPTELIQALRNKQWQRACVDLRHLWTDSAPVLFGHALLEKLVTPYKSITAHVFVVHHTEPLGALQAMDALVAHGLSASSLVPKPFIPLPVLGVPGWCSANENPGFYEDTQVFRLPKP
jgi:hypothetical protein